MRLPTADIQIVYSFAFPVARQAVVHVIPILSMIAAITDSCTNVTVCSGTFLAIVTIYNQLRKLEE